MSINTPWSWKFSENELHRTNSEVGGWEKMRTIASKGSQVFFCFFWRGWRSHDQGRSRKNLELIVAEGLSHTHSRLRLHQDEEIQLLVFTASRDVDIIEGRTIPERRTATLSFASSSCCSPSLINLTLFGDSTPVVLAPLPARSALPQARRYP